MSAVDHTDLLPLSDAELLRQCQVDTFRGPGRGGQKRNKTETAVRLRHGPSGLSAQSDETRSQHQNKARALALLRERIALALRRGLSLEGYLAPAELVELCRGAIGRRNPRYLPAVAALLDLLEACGGSVSETARRLGLSTGALSRLILADVRLHGAVNALRAARELRPLR